MRPFLHAAVVAALSSLACDQSHAVAVINRTDVVIEQVQVTVGENHAGLGGIGPGVYRAFLFSGRLGKEAVVEWKVGVTIVVPVSAYATFRVASPEPSSWKS
jgi:hypothetical protein